MYVFYILYRLKFNDYGLLHQEIQPVFSYFYCVIFYRHFHLLINHQTNFSKFNDQRIFIYRFNESGPKFFVDRYCGSDYCLCQFSCFNAIISRV